MTTTLIICGITFLFIILSVLFFPKIKIGKVRIDTYWIVTLVGVILLAACGQIKFPELGKALAANNEINPLKILALFIAMTMLSIFLDEVGFFRFLASKILKKAHSGQKKLFVYLYILVSILTIFTSNDIIILSFTPFICYFAKNAKIDPTPYLVAEFVAANTWSMMLIIGNPTNIYLATAYNLSFLSYLKISVLPTIFAGIVSFAIMFLLFRKRLSAKIEGEAEEFEIKDKLLFWVGVCHLIVCTLLLVISSYIGVEMWLVAVCSLASLILFNLVIALVRRKVPSFLLNWIKRLPYGLIPFVLSMFVIVVVLTEKGVSSQLASFLGSGPNTILTYGSTSFLSANLINNIPMSVLFSSIISSMPQTSAIAAVFATIVGSNIGAFLTPIGALAGIMWNSILNEQGVKFSYWDFLKTGAIVAIPTLFAALGGLYVFL